MLIKTVMMSAEMMSLFYEIVLFVLLYLSITSSCQFERFFPFLLTNIIALILGDLLYLQYISDDEMSLVNYLFDPTLNRAAQTCYML